MTNDTNIGAQRRVDSQSRQVLPPPCALVFSVPVQHLALISGDFLLTGGQDRAVLALAEHAAASGISTTIVAHRIEPALAADPSVHFQEVRRPLGMNVIGEIFLNRNGKRVAKDVTIHNGRVLVNGGNCQWPDVNWVHYVHAAFEPMAMTSLVRKVKGIYYRRRCLRTERSALRSARLVIANSRRTASDLAERLGVDPRRIRVIYYGIDGGAFAPANEEKRRQTRVELGWLTGRAVVAFIGALGDRRKGFDTAYAAWKQLCAAPDWDAELVVIGRGAELPVWQERAKIDGLSERIRFMGFRNDVPRLLDACDALIAPARYEAFGLGVLEALCKALPAIVSKEAGVAELYPADLADLLLENPSDPHELARRLTQWRARRDEYREKMIPFAEQCRSRSWNDMAADIIRAIDES